MLRPAYRYDSIQEDLCRTPELRIPGPAGTLEAVLECCDCLKQATPFAVLCHPHPLHGGTLHNKVVHTIARAATAIGVHALRFNFRGVGKSEGAYDHGDGEARDLLAATEWVRAHFPLAPVWLAGFSFGAGVALRAQGAAGCARLLLVAPPVERLHLGSIQLDGIPWDVIMGGHDEVVSPDAVAAWVDRQRHPPGYHFLEDGSHFFHGRLSWLRETVAEIWGGAVRSPCGGR